jgi:hypothetical protein
VGETPNQPFQLSFNPSLKVHFQGARVTSDSGLLLVRELEERLGLNELIQEHLTDQRRGRNRAQNGAIPVVSARRATLPGTLR